MPFQLLNMGELGLSIAQFRNYAELAKHAVELANKGSSQVTLRELGIGEIVDLTPPLYTDPVYNYVFQVSDAGETGIFIITPRSENARAGIVDEAGLITLTPGARTIMLGPNPYAPAAIVTSARTKSVYNIVWVDWDRAIKQFANTA